MIKRYVSVITLLFIFIKVFCQKKEIGFDALKQWPRLGGYSISNDGRYVWYAYSSEKDGSRIVLSDAKGNKVKEFDNSWQAKFTADSRHLILSQPSGIIYFNCEKRITNFFKGGTDPQIPISGSGKWLSIKREDSLFLIDLITGNTQRFGSVTKSLFDPDGKIFIIRDTISIKKISLSDNKFSTIYLGKNVEEIALDKIADKIAFTTANNQLFVYSSKLSKATLVAGNGVNGWSENIELTNGRLKFTADGHLLFFNIKNKELPHLRDSNVITSHVDVWHYADQHLQSEQLGMGTYASKERLAVVDLANGKTVVIENDTFSVVGSPGNQYVLVSNRVNELETYWNPASRLQFSLLALKSGVWKSFISRNASPVNVQLSPAEKFVTWYDYPSREYYSYEIATGKTFLLSSSNIKNVIDDGPNHRVKAPYFTIQCWAKDDLSLLACDKYDIWQINPRSDRPPTCLTDRYGRSNHISFRPLLNQNETVTPNDSLLIAGFSHVSKYNGFAKIQLSRKNKIQLRSWGSFYYYFPNSSPDFPVDPPQKSGAAQTYILQCQTDTMPSNLFMTKDFKTLNPISNIVRPPKYRAYESHLVKWKTAYGEHRDGILYVPEDLDKSKKHPILFNYYEQRSSGKFFYKNPSLSNTSINIPWYTSRGYIVFIPDIWPMRGHTGQAALETIVSGAQYLIKKYSWIDSSKMGLQGHSFGGYITNYVATHSDLFAAAQSSAGPTDLVSMYGGLGFNDRSLQFAFEVGQMDMGAMPWDSTSLYIENSCVFNLQEVSTPLLIMHNKDDVAVPFAQALELFTGLRRLQKKVWLLQYDNAGGHILNDDENGVDFTIRQQQFFDHYLKQYPAPEWMTRGVPAYLKGVQSGLN